jgi:hypothetical protein
LIEPKAEVIVDATGLDTRYVSQYFVWREGRRIRGKWRFPKLTVVCDRDTHLIAGALVTWGPSPDSPQFAPVVIQASSLLLIDRILADAGYDAEKNHALSRELLGVRSTVIPARKRNHHPRKLPKTKYRRQMRTRFFHCVYRQRWQVESAISRNKRLLGTALRARTWPSQKIESVLRVLTHNLLIL